MILLMVAVTAFAAFLGTTFMAAKQNRHGEADKSAIPTILALIGLTALVAGVWLLVILA